MGGKRKRTYDEWKAMFPDDLTVTKRNNNEILSCKYCCIEFVANSKISNRIREHVLESVKHAKLKDDTKRREKNGRQLTIEETMIRFAENKKKSDSAYHDFVYALSLSAIPLSKSAGPLGQLFKKWVPVCRSLPNKVTLRDKYLPDVFDCHLKCVKTKIEKQKISIIIDESPDILGRKTINVLFSFYDEDLKNKNVLLVECVIKNQCNSETVKNELNRIMEFYSKKWEDVIAISSDSAPYMKKCVRDIQIEYNKDVLHITDISHLVHIAVSHAFCDPSFTDLRALIIKFGNLFVNAHQLQNSFYDILQENNEVLRKPKQVVDHRWFSYYQTIVDIVNLWPYLMQLIDKNIKNQKIQKLKALLKTSKIKQVKFAILTSISDLMKPVFDMHKIFETCLPISHLIYKFYCDLNSIFNNQEFVSSSVLQSLDLNQKKEVEKIVNSFMKSLKNKWNDTTERNANEAIFGSNGILARIRVFDPFKKQLFENDIEYFNNVFKNIEKNELINLRQEFISYMNIPPPENLNITTITFWITNKQEYPILSKIAIAYLCIATSSLDAERSFSKLRDIQTPKRCQMNRESLRMQMILYFNGDIENKLNIYD